MPRPCKCRWIAAEPPVSAFKPVGVPGRQLEAIELGLDELEALRLADLEGLYHDSAAERMGVSRPTFGRLIERARHKVACALLQSKMLVFKGGPVMVQEQRTFECAECGARVQIPHGAAPPAECPSCHSKSFQRAADERGCGRGAPAGPGGGGHGGGGGGRGRCRRHRGGVTG
jgi:predicted DNA-binding protein (UPF0251 family)